MCPYGVPWPSWTSSAPASTVALVLAPLGHRVTHPALVTGDDVVHRLGCPLRPAGDVLAADVVLWRQRAPRVCDRCRAVLVTVLYSRPAGDD